MCGTRRRVSAIILAINQSKIKAAYDGWCVVTTKSKHILKLYIFLLTSRLLKALFVFADAAKEHN